MDNSVYNTTKEDNPITPIIPVGKVESSSPLQQSKAVFSENIERGGVDNTQIGNDGYATLFRQDKFGDGSDGDIVISANTTLTSDMYYNNLEVKEGFILNTGGYRIFVKNELSGRGTIRGNGNAGSNGTADSPYSGGAGGTGTSGTFSNVAGSSGANGSAGSAGSAGSNKLSTLNGNGKNGGAGGASTDFAGGSGGLGGSGTPAGGSPTNITEAISFYDFFNSRQFSISGGSGGGGSGGGLTPNTGGGSGGGGGASGIPVLISAKYIIAESLTFQSIGGNGGNGGDAGGGNIGDGGGGAGGNGGVIIIIYEFKTAEFLTSVAGGSGGSGGSNGTAGQTGSTGQIFSINV